MKGDICEIEGCDKIVRSGTICEVHGWRMRKYGSYDVPSRKKFKENCKVDGCKKLRYGRNSACGMHKIRYERYGCYELPVKIKKNLPENMVKFCYTHGYLTKDQVYLNPVGKYKHPQCIECRKISNLKYLKKTPSRHRNKYLKEKYEEFYKLQNGKCAICKQPELARSTNPNSNKNQKRLAIDHCHITEDKTGELKIRGLLCHSCNVSLGAFKDSIEILKSAIEYLENNK